MQHRHEERGNGQCLGGHSARSKNRPVLVTQRLEYTRTAFDVCPPAGERETNHFAHGLSMRARSNCDNSVTLE